MTAIRRPVSAPGPVLPHLARHLGPGAVLLACWLLVAPVLAGAGAPPVVGLLLAVPLVLLPLAVREAGRLRDREAPGTRLLRFAGVRRLAPRDLVVRVLPLALAAALLPGLALPVEAALRPAIGAVLPAWWEPGIAGLAAHPPGVVAATLVLWTVCAVLLGPVVEEVWFRGILQPRLPGGPAVRVVAGSLLFTVYHLWQPWAWPTVLLTALPLAVLRETRAGTTGAVLVHVAVNALVLPMLLAGLLQR